MEPQTLAQQAVAFLTPFLPYLLKAGEKAAEEVGKKLGEAAWEKAKALWGKLRPNVEAKPAAREAATDVAANPQDGDAQATLRHQLKKLLAEDETLAAEVARLLESEVVQRVLVEQGAQVRGVEQQAQGGPTTQEVIARDKDSVVEDIKQIRRG